MPVCEQLCGEPTRALTTEGAFLFPQAAIFD